VSVEFDDLYQEVILDHSKNPRNFREMEDADKTIDGFNPLCGDKIKLFLKVDDGVVSDISFQGVGCAISTASASLLTESLKGKSAEEAERIFSQFQQLVTHHPKEELDCDCLGKLIVFEGIRDYPMRVKCATLCWHALKAALKNDAEDMITTE
jgi:nitrogen fixation NifU-like protein